MQKLDTHWTRPGVICMERIEHEALLQIKEAHYKTLLLLLIITLNNHNYETGTPFSSFLMGHPHKPITVRGK